jgi:8-oxo-dGTP pyrophosphatase MutT (NUDIX family)
MKFLKVGRVAIITRGRYAGKKVRDTLRMQFFGGIADYGDDTQPPTARRRALGECSWTILEGGFCDGKEAAQNIEAEN